MYKTKEITKGVSLSYVHTEKFKTDFISMRFIAPLERETASLNALMLPVLMRGSGLYPSGKALSEKLDMLYDACLAQTVAKCGERQLFGFDIEILNQAYVPTEEIISEEMCKVLKELLRNPLCENGAFVSATVEREKQSAIDGINAIKNKKSLYAHDKCTENMCSSEKFGIPQFGQIAELEKITPESLWKQYEYALRNYPVEIFYVGNTDFDKTADSFAKIFEGIERTPVTIPETVIISAAEEVREFKEAVPVSQAHLVIGFRHGITLNSDELPALILFNAMYGGLATSKLFMNVREKMSLCYSCYSSINADKGIMYVSCGIAPENKEIAQNAVLCELDKIRNGDFEECDMQNALLGIANSYREIYDNPSSLSAWLLRRKLCKITDEAPEDVEKKLYSVTREEIISAAKKICPDTVFFLNGTLKGGDDIE